MEYVLPRPRRPLMGDGLGQTEESGVFKLQESSVLRSEKLPKARQSRVTARQANGRCWARVLQPVLGSARVLQPGLTFSEARSDWEKLTVSYPPRTQFQA